MSSARRAGSCWPGGGSCAATRGATAAWTTRGTSGSSGREPPRAPRGPAPALLDFLHENANLTYGWSIVVLTVIVRLVLLPLVTKQYSSMRRMQLYAPQMKELQQKYKGNRQKLNEELMAFYKENEINPFSSCLPLVAQAPVFIALYYVLRDFANDATVSGGDVSFMWVIPDVRLEFTDIGWGAAVIVIIYACSQLLSTELSMTPNMPDSQRRLMRLLPVGVIVFLFLFPVPAGLVLYWMTTNLLTCGQQLVMRHRIGLHLADPAEVEAITKKGSRTEPAAAAAAVAASRRGARGGRPRTTPRKRRRGAAAGANGGAAAPEPEPAPEPDLAEAEAAPEPAPRRRLPRRRLPRRRPFRPPRTATLRRPPRRTSRGAAGGGQRAVGVAGGSGGARRRQPRARGTCHGLAPGASALQEAEALIVAASEGARAAAEAVEAVVRGMGLDALVRVEPGEGETDLAGDGGGRGHAGWWAATARRSTPSSTWSGRSRPARTAGAPAGRPRRGRLPRPRGGAGGACRPRRARGVEHGEEIELDVMTPHDLRHRAHGPQGPDRHRHPQRGRRGATAHHRRARGVAPSGLRAVSRETGPSRAARGPGREAGAPIEPRAAALLIELLERIASSRRT